MRTTPSVAGYYRVSVARDGMHSPEIYEREIHNYCRYKNLSLARIYCDIDASAFRAAPARPALEELVRDRRRYAAVVIPKLSRFGRSVKDLVGLFGVFDDDGVSLVFLDMGIDTTTSQGRLLRHIMAAFAEYESDVKGDYARANHRHSALQGWARGGKPPAGYRRTKGERHYTIEPERAALVHDIFTLYSQGSTQYAIAKRLNAAYPDMFGINGLSVQRVGRMLDNPHYAALISVDGDLLPGHWEPIIERDLWDAVRRRREANIHHARQAGTAKRNTYLLSGLILCGLCGVKLLHRNRSRSPNGEYRCLKTDEYLLCRGGGITTHRADRIVIDAFLKRCSFILDKESSLGWAKLSIHDQKRLLAMAIESVTLVPRARQGVPRDIEIAWKPVAEDGKRILLVSEPVPPPSAPKGPDGHAERFRKETRYRNHRERSERSRRSAREWREFQAHRMG